MTASLSSAKDSYKIIVDNKDFSDLQRIYKNGINKLNYCILKCLQEEPANMSEFAGSDKMWRCSICKVEIQWLCSILSGPSF